MDEDVIIYFPQKDQPTALLEGVGVLWMMFIYAAIQLAMTYC